MTKALVMKPGDVVARLLDVNMDTPAGLQAIVGGYLEAIRLDNTTWMYVNEDRTGLEPNHLASKLIQASPYGSQYSQMRTMRLDAIMGGAVVFSSDGPEEVEPDQKAYDLFVKAGIDIAFYNLNDSTSLPVPVWPHHPSTVLVTNQVRTGTRSINPIPSISEKLLPAHKATVTRDEAFDMILQSWLRRGLTRGFTEEGYRIARDQIEALLRELLKHVPRADWDGIRLHYRNKFDEFVKDNWYSDSGLPSPAEDGIKSIHTSPWQLGPRTENNR